MTGVIVSTPPTVEAPPGSSGSNPSSLPGITYLYALLNIPQTWGAKQTFPLGNISVQAADVVGLVTFFSTTFEPIHNFVNQEITSGATASVLSNAKTVRVNKASGSATALTLPLALAMAPVEFILIADWKGDAGTNNITITPSGSEKIQGLSSWTIAADNGSVCLRPIPGVGYAI